MAALSPPSVAAVGSPQLPPFRSAGLTPLRPSPMSRIRGGGGGDSLLSHAPPSSHTFPSSTSPIISPSHVGPHGGPSGGGGAPGGPSSPSVSRVDVTTSPPSVYSSVGRLSIRPPPPVMDEEKLKKYKTVPCAREKSSDGGCAFGPHCDFAHSTEELRRSLNSVAYAPVICQIKGCVDPLCKYAHNMAESQYHPDVYKTKICSHWDKNGGCPRGVYCSFAHGKLELRNKTRKFADASVADPSAAILPVRLSAEGRSDGGRFAHFRSNKSRVTVGGPVKKEGVPYPYEGARGVLDRERRFSAPERLIGEQVEATTAASAATEVDVTTTSPAERARRRTVTPQHHNDRQLELRLLSLLDDVSVAHQRKAVCLSDHQQEALSLLMADGDRLPFLTLSALQQLSLYQQHALHVTTQLIQSYDISHPTASCIDCQDEEPSLLFIPCQHAVLCDECAKDCTQCPWKGCGQPIEAAQRIITTLPNTLLGRSNE